MPTLCMLAKSWADVPDACITLGLNPGVGGITHSHHADWSPAALSLIGLINLCLPQQPQCHLIIMLLNRSRHDHCHLRDYIIQICKS